MNADVSSVAAARALRAQLDTDRVVMSGPLFDESRRIWNGAVDHRPKLIVCAVTPADVQAAVRAARAHQLPLSVRGGGHDWAGRSMRDGGLVIDLTGMREVEVDADARIAVVAGGATAGDVIEATVPFQLVAATGTVGSVGMAGLTLAGGYGPLNGRFGLALDNLVGADVVLADGRLVTVDTTHDPELYWAIRGGGGNFGVVTSMRIRLHPLERLLAGFILFPWSQMTEVMSGLSGVLAAAPDELTVQSGVIAGPDGSPALFLSPAWSADLAAGEKAIQELQGLGSPMVSQVAPMSYDALLGLFDAYIVPGNHHAIKTRTVASLTPDVIAALADAGSALPSPQTGIAVHHFHGAATRVPLESTAFGLRQDHFVFEIVAAWEPGDGSIHRAWTELVSAALAPSALPGGYPNLLGPDEHEQIAKAYGHNTERLRRAKKLFDPDGVFTATPLPTTP